MIKVAVTIDLEKCDYCMECVEDCPTKALTFTDCGGFYHDPIICSNCECCIETDCGAVTIKEVE